MKKISPVLFLLVILTVFAVAGAGTSYYFYLQYQKTDRLLKNPTEAAKEEVRALITRVGKLMVLPKEDPQIATILDKEKVKDQAFFANSQNGDKVLIFSQARKAILYRPSSNIVIEVAPLIIGENQGTPSASQQTVQTISIALRNGTTTVGATRKLEEDLISKVNNINVVERENAKNSNFEKTIVVDVNGTKKDMATQLAQVIGATVGELPSGESKPQADFLIIIGSDRE